MPGLIPALLILALPATALPSSSQPVPPSFETLARQAEKARDENHLDEALTLYQKALKLKPGWDEGLWNAGSIAYDLDRYAECAPAFHRLAVLKPDSAPVWTMAGLCEYRLRHYDAALESLTQSERLKFQGPPELATTAKLHLALVLTKCHNFEKAIVILTELTRSEKKTPEIVVAAGIAGLRQPWLPFEVPAADQDRVSKLGDAMATAMEMDYKEALRKFEAVVTEYPKDANIRFRYGAFLFTQDADRGTEEIKQAVVLDPVYVPALVSLSVISLKRDENQAAVEFGERAVKADPADFSTHVALGRAFLALEDAGKAAAELEIATVLAPGSAQAHYSLASAYARMGRKEDSARELDQFKRLEQLRK